MARSKTCAHPRPRPGRLALLREEVFGPILPLVRVDGLDAALGWIGSLPAPLAVYLFTRDRQAERRCSQPRAPARWSSTTR